MTQSEAICGQFHLAPPDPWCSVLLLDIDRADILNQLAIHLAHNYGRDGPVDLTELRRLLSDLAASTTESNGRYLLIRAALDDGCGAIVGAVFLDAALNTDPIEMRDELVTLGHDVALGILGAIPILALVECRQGEDLPGTLVARVNYLLIGEDATIRLQFVALVEESTGRNDGVRAIVREIARVVSAIRFVPGNAAATPMMG